MCVQPINHNIIATQPEQNQPNCRKRGIHSHPGLLQYYCVQPWHRSKFLEPVPWTITLPNWNQWQTLLQSPNEGAQEGWKPKYKRIKIVNMVDVIPRGRCNFNRLQHYHRNLNLNPSAEKEEPLRVQVSHSLVSVQAWQKIWHFWSPDKPHDIGHKLCSTKSITQKTTM